MIVTKRNGKTEPVSFDKITRRIQKLTYGLNKDFIDVQVVSQSVIQGLTDGVNTIDLDKLAAETCASKTSVHPDYSILAARIEISSLHKQTEKSFSKVMKNLFNYKSPTTGKHLPKISEKFYNVVKQNAAKIDAHIDFTRDFTFTFFGFKTLERSYLLKIDNKIVERPQHMFMRVALGIHMNNINKAIETYDLMSQRYFTHATPTLFNAGTVLHQLSSCFLLTMKEDSIHGIYDTLKDCALISKTAGGIGLAIHNIRSDGSYIADTGGTSNGIIPMLRVFNNTARYVDQGGNKRPGSFAIYLEPWHPEIFEFIELRKNTGKEEVRARDLFLALWVPDLFMKRVEADQDWSLFCPNEAPGLSEVYGEEFEELYSKYEKENRARKTIKAQKLWSAIIDAQIETGTPYILYKDACNSKSNQKNLGTIKSSNLCTEILQYTSPEETAVCNLASICLPTFVDEQDRSFDYAKLLQISKVVTFNLNCVIDENFYPTEESKRSNKKHRPIGIGVQGLADVFAMLKIPFDSPEAKLINKEIFETIYFGALEASCELSQEFGPYESFEGSPASQGILQFDLWGVKPILDWKWDELKEKIKEYGLRNSLLLAPMPTASTSQIMGFNECFEPFTSNLYQRRTASGEFQLMNPYLVKDLIKIGKWNEVIKNELMANNGSVLNLDIPTELKEIYKTVWEISQKVIIDMAADRGAYIDQSQSLNIHIANANHGKLTSMHFYGWKKGLKTGMYYLRTKAAADAIKFTVDQNKLKKKAENEIIACSIENPESCEMCSG